MLAVERRKQILEQVHKDKKVIVSELSRQFRVSEETIAERFREAGRRRTCNKELWWCCH